MDQAIPGFDADRGKIKVIVKAGLNDFSSYLEQRKKMYTKYLAYNHLKYVLYLIC